MKKLNMDDSILAVWSEEYCGPDWTSTLVHILIQSDDRKLRIESLQMEEQSREMHILSHISMSVNKAMVSAARAHLKHQEYLS